MACAAWPLAVQPRHSFRRKHHPNRRILHHGSTAPGQVAANSSFCLSIATVFEIFETPLLSATFRHLGHLAGLSDHGLRRRRSSESDWNVGV